LHSDILEIIQKGKLSYLGHISGTKNDSNPLAAWPSQNEISGSKEYIHIHVYTHTYIHIYIYINIHIPLFHPMFSEFMRFGRIRFATAWPWEHVRRTGKTDRWRGVD
jgi:hypothetical protein